MPTYDRITDTLREVVDQISSKELEPISVFGNEITGIKPTYVNLIQNIEALYGFRVKNGAVLSPIEGNIAHSNNALLKICIGDENLIGGSIVRFSSLAEDPEALNIALLNGTTTSSMYDASKVYLTNIAQLHGYDKRHMDMITMSEEDVYKDIRRNEKVIPEFEESSEYLKEFTRRLCEYEGVINAEFVFNGIHTYQRVFNSEGTELGIPSQKGKMNIVVTVRNNSDENVKVALPYYTSSMQKCISLSSILEDPKYLHAKLGADSWEDMIGYMRNSKEAKVSRQDMVLSNSTFGVYVHEGILAHLISGKYLLEGLTNTYHPERKGSLVLSPSLSIYDDPTITKDPSSPRGYGSYLYDVEGVVGKKIKVIENGRFMGQYLLDRESAGRIEKKYPDLGITHSNGHARVQMSFISDNYILVPEPRISNLYIESNEHISDSLDDMIGSLEGGVVLMGGGGEVDPNTGNFYLYPNITWQIHEDGSRTMLTGGFVPLNALNFPEFEGFTKERQTNGGTCGAQSGNIATSSTSPAAMISNVGLQYETQEKQRKNLFVRQ